MFSNPKIKTLILVPLLIFACLMQGTQAYAAGGRKTRGGGVGDIFHGSDSHGGGNGRHFALGNPYWGAYSCGSWFAPLPLTVAPPILADPIYYYYEGAYYQRMENGYVVVPAPVNPVVTVIPARYQPAMINGVAYYDFLP